MHVEPTRRVVLLGVLLVGALSAGVRGQPETRVAGQIDVARLVDLAAERAGVRVEYDAARVTGRVTLRGQEALSDQQLWVVANRVLASRGLATVRLAGDDTLSVVAITEAAALARIESFESLLDGEGAGRPGYATVLYESRHAEPLKLLESARAYASRTGSSMSQIGTGRGLLISDLSARLEQIRDVLRRVDVPPEGVGVGYYEAVWMGGEELAAMAMEARDRAGAMGLSAPRGGLTGSGGRGVVTIVAPESELERWRELLERLDRGAPLVTRVYSPGWFGLDEVAGLVEEVVAPTGRAEAGAGAWALVRDTLTNSMVVTAPPGMHVRVAEVLERLDAAPISDRRAARYFPIRHRAVGEVVGVLEGLLRAGVGAAAAGRADGSDDGGGGAGGLADGLGPRAAGGGAGGRGGGGRGEPEIVLATDEATNTLIALGEPRLIAQIEGLLRTLDVRQSQVMLEVVLVSLSAAQTRNLGVELAGLVKTGEVRVRLASLFGLSTIAGGLPGGGLGGAGGTATVLAPEDFALVVRALETVNAGRSMSVPRVLVGNGQQASLNSTLGQPVTSVNASDTVATTSFAGFSDAGTQVSITPRISAGDHLLLEYSITLSAFVGESPGPGIPPPRQQNQLQSVVTIPDGHTVVVGGIELVTEADAESRVPLLGSIPVIREAFRNRARSENRQRFFVFIRAEVDRGRSFEGLRHVSEDAAREAGVEDGWPEIRARVIR